MRAGGTALGLAAFLAAGGAAALELSPLEAAGKRLYREGISARGEAPAARVGAQGTVVKGSAVPCAGCHGADGRGRPEGGLRPPDITWAELAKAYGHRHGDGHGREHPPFDEASFFRAVTEGLDPAGHRLDPAMPRYALAWGDAAALAAYLKRIGEDRDPGLEPAVLRVGTLLPRTGPLAEAGRLVEKVLRGVFEQANAAGGIHGRRLELAVEEVEGPTPWRERLSAADVFALVAPLVPGGAVELDSLAQAADLPVVGPLAGEGGGSGQVFRIWPGEAELGRALAEFAVRSLGFKDPEVAVVAAGRGEGAAAAEAQLARHGWRRISRPAPGQDGRAALAAWRARGVKAVFHFGSPEHLARLRREAAAAGWNPVFLAPAGRFSVALGGGGGPVYLAAPALPGEGGPGRRALEEIRRRQDLPRRHEALQAAAFAAATVLVEGLKRAGRGASRAALVDALENLHGFDTGVTAPLAFGPGRRVGILGAWVLALDPAGGGLVPAGPFVQLD